MHGENESGGAASLARLWPHVWPQDQNTCSYDDGRGASYQMSSPASRSPCAKHLDPTLRAELRRSRRAPSRHSSPISRARRGSIGRPIWAAGYALEEGTSRRLSKTMRSPGLPQLVCPCTIGP